MNEPRRISEIASYHAHIYFQGPAEAERARWLRERIAERFAVRMGTWWERPVGPHDRSMYQVAFETGLFPAFVPWLMLNHSGLSILIHPNTANQRRDHLADSLWIGTKLPLDEAALPDDESEPEQAGTINTAPRLTP
jgi:DOPA 4,5-dioxygenase